MTYDKEEIINLPKIEKHYDGSIKRFSDESWIDLNINNEPQTFKFDTEHSLIWQGKDIGKEKFNSLIQKIHELGKIIDYNSTTESKQFPRNGLKTHKPLVHTISKYEQRRIIIDNNHNYGIIDFNAYTKFSKGTNSYAVCTLLSGLIPSEHLGSIIIRSQNKKTLENLANELGLDINSAEIPKKSSRLLKNIPK
jgi:uncharacterized protein (UPF0128 family)